MRFRTRLIITSSAIVILPLILTFLAFLGIGRFVINGNLSNFSETLDYGMISNPGGIFNEMTEEIFNTVQKDMEEDPHILEDKSYLKEIEETITYKSSFIIVRKDHDIYYTGSKEKAAEIFNLLPEYGITDNTGFYYTETQQLAKQMDFEFSDGSKGSFFIITKIKTFGNTQIIAYMFLAIVVILIVTSFVFSYWISRSFFKPIDELNIAMKHISDGNFDYILPTDINEKGEIGEMYRNYEDMRLRLKESADEKIVREKQNKELISNISHDLKTPITAIKGYSQGLLEGVADTPERQQKYIRTIYSKANDMNNLINELTLYSSIDNNRIPYNFTRINVADYFGDCIEEVGVDMENKNIKLNYSNLTTPETLIVADPEQLKRVINNIINNSVKYLGREDGTGIIDIRILDEVDSIRVEIEDNGKGIAQKDISSIFDRFYRTDSSRNSKQGGSGIGLSIVKKIIEDHGGYIWATSQENEGTCMHFVLRKYIEYQHKPETEVTIER
ncbi:MAG: HAMP domain-containing histidine kinase [Butyrivibrio sp.]|nr:HAMP domain-containing histidine kinase [Butyrivibrio sp.]